jgi:hypothetical protein
MANDVVMVLTSKSLETMEKEGGSGNWAARRDRLEHARWIVAVRNRHSNWSQGDEEHGSAFLIGQVTGVKPSPPSQPNRFIITFDQYAELKNPEKVWGNNRNPVTYTSLSELGIEPEKLDWKPFSGAPSADEIHASSTPGAVIDQARAMIASSLAISPDAVKITIAL